MSDTVFNNKGVPLISYGTRHFMTTKGGPVKNAAAKKDEKPNVSKQTATVEDKTTVNGKTVVSWGSNNDFPTLANNTIRTVDVLNTGLKFIRNFTIGQGIFPCTVTGYDENGNEKLEIIDDAELIAFCQSRLVRRYLEKALRDYLKFGRANVQLVPNTDGTKMVGLNAINAMHCRDCVAEDGVIRTAIVSGKWPDTPADKEYEEFTLLDEYDPFADLERMNVANKIKGQNIMFPIRDSWSNAEYYSEPVWWSAYEAGWIDIAKSVPGFLKKAFANQITWKWHIQIPYAFWDKKFPDTDFETVPARQAAIESYMDTIEDNLCGQENADKPIFTFFEVNANGKVEEQWIITALDNKYKENDKLFTSAAANSEILFSLMINPNVLGAGMPGGTYAGNQGGSNIREAFLVNIANSWVDRQNILDPIELFLQFNGKKDVQLRFRQTILTTLDTGAGSKKTLS